MVYLRVETVHFVDGLCVNILSRRNLGTNHLVALMAFLLFYNILPIESRTKIVSRPEVPFREGARL